MAFDPRRADIDMQGIAVCRGGLAADFSEDELKKKLDEPECSIQFTIARAGTRANALLDLRFDGRVYSNQRQLSNVKPILLLPLLLFQLAAQPPAETTPKDVLTLIRETAEDLSNKDASAFLNHFDPKMPGYETLHYEVEGLAARDAIVSTIEIVTDKGDNQRRTMELDWILIVESDPSQRKVVKVTVERQGKQWKITALDPVEFFKPTAAP